MSEYYHVRLAISEYERQFRSELFTEDLGDTDGDLLPAEWDLSEEWLPSLLRGADDLDSTAARSVGKQLYEYLLGHSENSKKWAEILRRAERLQRSVRLLIDATSEKVRDLPYGLLCEPHDNYFLLRPAATRPNVTLVRIVRRATPRALRLPRPIRVLVAAAEPSGREFDCAESVCALSRSLYRKVDLSLCTAKGTVRLEHALLGAPEAWQAAQFAPFCITSPEVLRAGVQGPYDILHLLGHGFGDSVWLCNGRGDAVHIHAEELAGWCSRGRLQMAFLQVCRGAETGSRGGFGGLAQQLINPKVGNLAAAVASVYPLQAQRSTQAGIRFYEALAKGVSPDTALSRDGAETDWTWAFLELWVRPQALGKPGRGAFQFVSPYRGLARFEERDADIFFGRDSAVAEVLKILRDEPVLAVVGDSGSGKSSLLHAGIAHRVRNDGLLDTGQWRIISTRPGSSGLLSLRNALKPDAQAVDTALIDVLTEHLRDGSSLLLIIDQFEELFTLSVSENDRQLMAETLAQVILRYPKSFRVLIGLRSDYVGSLVRLRGLRDLVKRPWILKPPTRDETRDIIEQPAARADYTFEGARDDGNPEHAQSLLARILADPLVVGSSQQGLSVPIYHGPPLPLIEFALERLWLKAIDRDSQEFTHSDFDQLKGLQGAVGDYAEQVYQDLPRQPSVTAIAQTIAEQVFTSLVTADNTRRPRRKAELEQEVNSPGAREVIDHLVGERLLVIRNDPENSSESLVDVTHEVLITHWQRLAAWLNTTRDERRIADEVEQAARKWYESSRDKNYLDHRASRLSQAKDLRDSTRRPGFRGRRLGPVAEEYIDACENAEKARAHLKAFLWFSSLAVSAIFAVFFFVQFRTERNLNGRLIVEGIAASVAASKWEDAHRLIKLGSTQLGQGSRELRLAAWSVFDASPPAIAQLRIFEAGVTTSAIARNRKELYVGNRKGDIAVVSSRTLLIERVFRAAPGEIRSITVDERTGTLVTAQPDGTIAIWNDFGRKLRCTYFGALRELWTIDVNSALGIGASAGDGGQIHVWRVADCSEVRSFSAQSKGAIERLIFNGIDDHIYVAGADRTIVEWAARTGEQIANPMCCQSSDILQLRQASGRRIFSSSADGSVAMWDQDTGRIAIVGRHSERVAALDVTADGNSFATGSNDRSADIWHVGSQTPRMHFTNQRSEVIGVYFTHADQTLLTVSVDGIVGVWPTRSPVLCIWRAHNDSISHLQFMNDSRLLLSSSFDGTAALWDVTTTRLVKTFPNTGDPLNSALVIDSDRIVGATHSGYLKVWSITGALMKTQLAHHGSATALTAGMGLLLSAGRDGYLRVWDSTSIKRLGEVWLSPNLISLAFDPKSRIALVAGEHNYLGAIRLERLGDTVTFRKVITATYPTCGGEQAPNTTVTSVAVSSNHHTVQTGGDDGYAVLWKNEDLLRSACIGRHSAVVTEVGFEPSGDYLFSTGEDGRLDIRNTETQQLIVSYKADGVRFNTGAVSSDLNSYALGSVTGEVHLVRTIDLGEPISEPVQLDLLRARLVTFGQSAWIGELNADSEVAH